LYKLLEGLRGEGNAGRIDESGRLIRGRSGWSKWTARGQFQTFKPVRSTRGCLRREVAYGALLGWAQEKFVQSEYHVTASSSGKVGWYD
jgi:hypothetical protein